CVFRATGVGWASLPVKSEDAALAFPYISPGSCLPSEFHHITGKIVLNAHVTVELDRMAQILDIQNIQIAVTVDIGYGRHVIVLKLNIYFYLSGGVLSQDDMAVRILKSRFEQVGLPLQMVGS